MNQWGGIIQYLFGHAVRHYPSFFFFFFPLLFIKQIPLREISLERFYVGKCFVFLKNFICQLEELSDLLCLCVCWGGGMRQGFARLNVSRIIRFVWNGAWMMMAQGFQSLQMGESITFEFTCMQKPKKDNSFFSEVPCFMAHWPS